MDKLGVFLGTNYLLDKEEQTASGIHKEEHLLQERAGIGAEGSVYSREFLLYDAAGIFGLAQDWAEDQEGSAFDDGRFYEGDVTLQLFPKRIHPASFFFSRVHDVQPRVFLREFESTTTTLRAQQQLLIPKGSLRLEGLRRQTEHSQLGLEGPTTLDVTETQGILSADYTLSDRQNLFGGYTFLDVNQTIGSRSYSSHNVDLNHRLSLGAEKEHSLRSRVEGTLQEGDLDQKLLRWDENLTWRFLENLHADAAFSYLRNDTNVIDFEEIRGNAGLTHQLYQSLTTSLSLNGSATTTRDQGTTDTVGENFSINYRKKTPWGTYRLSYASSFERRFVENFSGITLDESHTFPAVPPEEVRLFRPRVDVSSVRVKDTSGLIYYREGLDYRLREEAGGYVTVERIFTSLIPRGGTILVDYVYVLGSDYTLDTLSHNVRTEHEFFFGLVPYFSFMRYDQDIAGREGTAGVAPVDEESLMGGLEYRTSPVTAGVEYEDRSSTILPFEAFRLHARGSNRFGKWSRLSGSLTQGWIFYKQPNRRLATSQGSAVWQTAFSDRFDGFLEVNGYYQDDSLQGDAVGYSVAGALSYRWRRFLIQLRAGHRELKSAGSVFRGTDVGVWILRNFGTPPDSLRRAAERFRRQRR